MRRSLRPIHVFTVALCAAAACQAAPAWAQAPLDAAGAYVHALTVRPVKMAQPQAIGAPTRLFAYGADAAGGFTLVGDGEYLTLDRHGRLDRRALDRATSAYPAFGHVIAAPSQLWYCDATAKAVRHLSAGGASLVDLLPFEVSGACTLYRDGQGGYTALQGFPYLAWHLGPDGKVRSQFAVELAALRKPGGGIRPCGGEPGGRALGTVETFAPEHKVELVRLGPTLQPEATLWSLTTPQTPLGEFIRNVRLSGGLGCTLAQGKAVFWTHNAVYTFHRDQLVSALHGGTPLEPATVHPSAAVGPYTFQILGAAHLLGGEVLVVAERDQGDVRFYLPPPTFAPADALREATRRQAAGEVVQAHRAYAVWLAAHPGDAAASVAQVDNLLAGGWWEAVEILAKEHAAAHPALTARLAPLQARARLLQLLRWTGRNQMATVAPGSWPGNPLAAYVTESSQLAAAHPHEPLGHLAASRLARLAGQSSAALRHLAPLAALLHQGRIRADDFPELFEVFAARGDIDGMRRMVKALAKTGPSGSAAPEHLQRVWPVRLLRAEGKFEAALQLLGESTAVPVEHLALRAQLQVDAGQLQDAILTWTRVLQLTPQGHPEAQAGLGVAYLRRGLVELAVQALTRAVDADKDNAAWRSNLAEAYGALDKRDDAMQQLFGALAQAPKDPVLRYQLAELQAARVPVKAPVAPALAVLPLATSGGALVRVGLGEMLASMLTTAIVESGRVTVLERTALKALLAEQKLQVSAHIDPSTAVRLGKLAGAKDLVLGNVAEFEAALHIDLRRVDTGTGRILAATSVKSRLDLDDLRKALAQALPALLAVR